MHSVAPISPRQRLLANFTLNCAKVHLKIALATDELKIEDFFCLFVLFSARRKPNVKYHYNADLDVVYLSASDESGIIGDFYLASPSSATVNLCATESIRSKLIQAHAQQCHDVDKVQLILAIVDSNTTIVYYRLSLGLVSMQSVQNERKSMRLHPKCDNNLQKSTINE